jgi:enoyl-CoA hydratase/carnithine racemase|tara:strand:+ start:1630 stop:2502 length:873 start_codon:yes stop_codon:yes gene_type:complete
VNYNTLTYVVSDGILTLTLNRPDQLNSFTLEMASELVDAFHLASEDDAVGAIVVTGAGRAFCAGMDLSVNGNVFGLDESQQPTLEDVSERGDEAQILHGVRDEGGLVSLAIFECKKPVIAAINGAAVGVGATMTCAMDIRLVSTKAKVGFVFNKIGITPEACSSWFLPRVVGLSTALEWCYTAEILEAETLVDAGFAKAAHEPDDLLPAAYAIAQKIVKHSPVAIALTRQMMYRNSAQEHPRDAHNVDSLAIFYASIGSGKEGVQSFLEKREAVFRDSAKEMPPFYPWWT